MDEDAGSKSASSWVVLRKRPGVCLCGHSIEDNGCGYSGETCIVDSSRNATTLRAEGRGARATNVIVKREGDTVTTIDKTAQPAVHVLTSIPSPRPYTLLDATAALARMGFHQEPLLSASVLRHSLVRAGCIQDRAARQQRDRPHCSRV